MAEICLAIKVPKSIESRIEGYLTKDKDLDLDNWEPSQDEIDEIKEWFRPKLSVMLIIKMQV